MKVETILNPPVDPPIKEVILYLSEQEAFDLATICYWNQISSSHRTKQNGKGTGRTVSTKSSNFYSHFPQSLKNRVSAERD